jgi:hypothetical protein
MAVNTPRKRPGKRAELSAWLLVGNELEGTGTRQIGEAEFEELRRALAPISESYLRRLLRESGAALSPMVEGVRQGNFDELEASLIRMLDQYEKADPKRRAAVRRLVIAAKDHARWASRRPEKRAEKEEMALWMLTWLENPPLFPDWVKLRRAQL